MFSVIYVVNYRKHQIFTLTVHMIKNYYFYKEEIILLNKMIHLDYYRLLPETHYIGTDEEQDADCRFTPYSIFVLETRLYPLIYKLFKEIDIDILIQTFYSKEKKRMNAYLVIKELVDTTDAFIEDKLVEISDSQRKIITDKIYEIKATNPNYTLIDVKELYDGMPIKNNTRIPFTYFSTMLQYTGIDSKFYEESQRENRTYEASNESSNIMSFNPFIRPEGIYLTFNPDSDYKTAYYEVCKFLTKRIQEFYDKGAIVFGNLIDDDKREKIIKDWKLVPIDSSQEINTLYEPNWIDERFAKNKVDFLTLKLQGDPFIRIKVSDNFVKRHGIAVSLQKYEYPMIFEGSYLKVEVKNLDEARHVASLVEYATGITHGRVMTLAANRLSEIYLYFEYAAKLGAGTDKKKNAITYSVNSNENPYVFSCFVDTNINLDDLRLKFRDYAVERLIEVSKISKFKNISPHTLIEQEYS